MHSTLQLKAKLEEEVKSSEGKQRKVKDKTESELMEICLDFECDLRAERVARMGTEDALGVMKMSVSVLGCFSFSEAFLNQVHVGNNKQ